jgi:hypothetical protein
MRFSSRVSPYLKVICLLCLLFVACSCSLRSEQEIIDKMAQDIQAELPKKLDADTMLVNVYTKELELVSEYELVNYTPTESDREAVKDQIESYLNTQVCPGIKKELLGKGISSRYIYKAKSGEVVLDALLSPGDC